MQADFYSDEFSFTFLLCSVLVDNDMILPTSTDLLTIGIECNLDIL